MAKVNYTEDKAREILKALLAEDSENNLGINWNNLRRVKGTEKSFRVTADKLSLSYLIYMLESDYIDDVYFHPSVAPPRDDVLSTAMRYHLYITFN